MAGQKPSASQRGQDFEILVESVFKLLLRVEGFHDASIERHAKIQGIGRLRMIDVAFRFRLFGVDYLTIVEAKNWNSKVTPEKIDAFKACLDDIPGQPRGIMMTSQGVQSGVTEMATAYGIKVCTIKKRGAGSETITCRNEVPELNVTVTGVTLTSSAGDAALNVFVAQAGGIDALEIVNVDESYQKRLLELVDVLRHRYISEGANGDSITGEFEGTRWIRRPRDGAILPIDRIQVYFDVSREIRVLEASLDRFFSHVIDDLIPGRRLLVTPDLKLLNVANDQMVGMCDFCGYPTLHEEAERNHFVGRDIVLKTLERRSQVQRHMGKDWAGCDECAKLIRDFRPIALVQRALEISKYLGPRSFEGLNKTQSAFWLGYLKEQAQILSNWTNPRFRRVHHEYLEIERQDLTKMERIMYPVSKR